MEEITVLVAIFKMVFCSLVLYGTAQRKPTTRENALALVKDLTLVAFVLLPLLSP